MSIGYEESSVVGIEDGSHPGKPAISKHQTQEQVPLSTEPLKIPLPKTGIVKPYADTETASTGSAASTGNTVTSTTTSGLGTEKGIVKGKNSYNYGKFLGDSPQIFSIESRTEQPSSSFTKLGGDEGCKGKEVDYSAFGTGYRDNRDEVREGVDEYVEGGSSGVQEESDFDSDEGNSPFYSSDIDSDASSEPPLLWNFADYFANLPGNDWCTRIPQCFIEDEFNLFELPNVFKCALTLTDTATNEQQRSANASETEESDDYSFDDLIDFITIEDLTGKVVDVLR